ncbi:MAG: 50S ribosomal protein L31 [Rickettsiales bacterium]|nr:50S ribosomal protein L31 [Rickettsiales bacterium]
MKKKIHPEYHEIKVVMTDGSEFKTRSTFGKPGEILKLDVDPISHPAWTGGNAQIREDAGQVARFKKKFGNIKV